MIHKSLHLRYEPFSVPLHISAKQFCLLLYAPDIRGGVTISENAETEEKDPIPVQRCPLYKGTSLIINSPPAYDHHRAPGIVLL